MKNNHNEVLAEKGVKTSSTQLGNTNPGSEYPELPPGERFDIRPAAGSGLSVGTLQITSKMFTRCGFYPQRQFVDSESLYHSLRLTSNHPQTCK